MISVPVAERQFADSNRVPLAESALCHSSAVTRVIVGLGFAVYVEDVDGSKKSFGTGSEVSGGDYGVERNGPQRNVGTADAEIRAERSRWIPVTTSSRSGVASGLIRR